MAKIVVAFEGRIIRDHGLEKDETTIGRAADCDIRLESLNVEPLHARIQRQGADHRIIAEHPEKPLLVHHAKVTEQILSHEDLIQLGKYSLTYVEDRYDFLQITQSPAPEPDDADQNLGRSGYLQVLNGSRVGRIIPLKQSLTRLGLTNDEAVLVAHRHEGYFLSQLKGLSPPQVNGRSIGEEAQKLVSGDQLTIGLTTLKFFIE